MNRLIVTVAAASLSLMWPAPAEEAITGQWMIDPTPLPDQIELTLHRSNHPFGSHTNSSSFPVNQLKGLSRAQRDSPGGLTARFEIARDAGTLACEGYFKQGHGAGQFTFSPDASFISDMRGLGYSNLSQEQVYSMAVHDVTRKYVRDLRSLGVANASDDLITMRIHNVTIEYIKELQSLGYAKLQTDQLVTMRIHGVETEFIRELNQLGYRSVPTDELVTLRIHDATTEFIKQLKALGYDHPSIDQLVTMRIHGVTPAYIQHLHTRGMNSLSIDQLVGLRIHGITD
jgi:hypothetical protein